MDKKFQELYNNWKNNNNISEIPVKPISLYERVLEDSTLFQFIKEPTEDMCLTVVKDDGEQLKFINNPSKEIILEALKQNGRALQFVQDKTEELIKIALENEGTAIEFIEEPTEEMKWMALNSTEYALEFIDNPSEEMCYKAINKSGFALEYIANPTPEMCLEAVKRNGLALEYVSNPTYEMCLEAVKQEGMSLKYVKEQSLEIVFEAILKTLGAFRHIDIEKTPELVSFIADITVKNESPFNTELREFPKEILSKMVGYQILQNNNNDLDDLLSDEPGKGFERNKTEEGEKFWEFIIDYKEFDIFFEKYPILRFSEYKKSESLELQILDGEKKKYVIEDFLKDYIPDGDLKIYPLEIIDKLLQYQLSHTNNIDISVFENDTLSGVDRGGFDWKETEEGIKFWEQIIINNEFDLFFERYPEKKFDNEHLNNNSLMR